MVIKKTYNKQMPDWIREFISELLGSFMQLYLILISLMLGIVSTNRAKRMYTDPNYCLVLPNTTQYNCNLNSTDFMGKKEGDDIYIVRLDALFILVITLTWAGSLLGSLMISLPVSGGYLNPAISVTLATMSRLEWKKLLHYIPAQYFGAFCAALCFHVLYYKHIDGRDHIILYVLTSTPHPRINMWTAMADSFFASFIFSFFLFAIIDKRSDPVPKYAQPLLITFVLIGIILGFFANTKLQLSPARDFGTRLYAALVVGFEQAFSPYSYCFWWLPKQICLYAGALAGGWLYVGLFSSLTKEKVSENKDQTKSDNSNNEERNVKINQTNGQNLKQNSKT